MILPAIESGLLAEEAPRFMLNFIGHGPVIDQYKLLCTITVISDNMEKIMSKARGSWNRKMDARDFHHHLLNPLELNMNGVLYYLAWIDMHTYVLVRFDIRFKS